MVCQGWDVPGWAGSSCLPAVVPGSGCQEDDFLLRARPAVGPRKFLEGSWFPDNKPPHRSELGLSLHNLGDT
jgi:hypothetical protein